MHRLLLLGSGSWMAVICAIHCAITPIFLTASPLLVGQWLHSEWMEASMIGLSMILGGIPLYKGFMQHKMRKPILFFVIALLLFSLNILFFHEIVSLSITLSLTGASLMIAAQMLNTRHIKTCTCVHN